MKKINFTTLKKIVLIAVAVSFVIWSCQDEKTTIYTSKDNPTVQEKITEQEWQQIRKSEPFITAYNDLVTINKIMEDTGLTYDELLEYAYKEESRYKYQQKIEKSIIKDFIIEDVQSFDATLKALAKVNEKVEKSSYLQELLIRQLYSYTWYIEDNMDKIAAFYIKKIEAEIASTNPNLAARRTPNCSDRRMRIRIGGSGVAYTLTSQEVIIKANPRIRKPYIRPSFYYPTFTYNPNRRGNGIRFPKTRPHYGGTRTKTKPKRVRVVIDRTNNSCVSHIIKELQKKDLKGALVPKLEGKVHLSQTILDLFGKCKNYDLVIKIGNLGRNSKGNLRNAITRGIESITLDKTMVKQATKLSIARTLIHESLHVYINYKINENKRSDFVKKLQTYHIKYNNNNLTQHEFMSQFVEALANSLSVYDFHRQKPSYYKAMSWAGLETSSAYAKLSKKEKRKIQKIIHNERFNKKGAKGSKCN